MKEEQDTIFISYRSTTYRELDRCGCKVIHDKVECNRQTAINCDVLHCSYRRAAIFANRQKYRCYIVPPTYMLPPESLLRVSDFLEKSPQLYNLISNSDIFVRFEIEEDSIWTELELKFWERHSLRKDTSRYYEIGLNNQGETECEEVLFRPMGKDYSILLDRLIYYTRDENRFDHAWGAYSSCFISVCPNCGEITLYSPMAIKYLIKNSCGINCTFCHEGNFYQQYVSKGEFLISCEYIGPKSQITSLDVETIISFLLDSNKVILENVHLICLSHESFHERIPMVQMLTGMTDYMKKCVTGTDIELRTYNKERHRIDKIPMMNIRNIYYSFDAIESFLG